MEVGDAVEVGLQNIAWGDENRNLGSRDEDSDRFLQVMWEL